MSYDVEFSKFLLNIEEKLVLPKYDVYYRKDDTLVTERKGVG